MENTVLNAFKIQIYISNKVDKKIENHYPYDEGILAINGETANIIKNIENEYAAIIDSLIINNELEDLNSANRNEFLYGENSINNRILELIEGSLKTYKTICY